MLLSLIQLLAGVAVVLLLVTWVVTTDTVAIVTGLLGFIAWALVAYGLFNIETVGSAETTTEPAFALFALAAAVVTVIPAFVEPFEAVGDAGETTDPMDRL